MKRLFDQDLQELREGLLEMDHRFITAVLKTTGELERIGD